MSKKAWLFVVYFAVVSGFAATAFHASAFASDQKASEFGKPLTAFELLQLYQGRSWLWGDGAGYFSPEQRRFTAATGKGSTASSGEGRWFITDSGKLCFKATWVTNDGSTPVRTCFSHRKKGTDVYQKREPDGEWYVFKHSPVREADEYAKFRLGDYVTGSTKAGIQDPTKYD
jgi:Protein of unknown function (DUF995)